MNLIEKFRTIVFGQAEQKILAKTGSADLEVLRSRKNILQELITSKDQRKLVGIFSPALGEGMFVTGIEDIYKWEKEEIVVLKPYDVGGNILQRNYLSVSEIKSVCPLHYAYRNPFVNRNQTEEAI